jgi:hypothetical protein
MLLLLVALLLLSTYSYGCLLMASWQASLPSPS